MDKVNQARALISGGFADFLTYLSGLEHPMIIGRDYPQKRLLECFQTWATGINFSPSDANTKIWRLACKEGLLSNTKK